MLGGMSGPTSVQTDILAFLRQVELTAGFSEHELEALASIAELRAYADGEILFSEGQQTSVLFLLFRGQVEVYKDVTHLPDPYDELPEEQPLTLLEQGALLGGVSFVDGEPASATAQARGPCQVLMVTRDRLAQTAAQAPTLESRLLATVTRAVVRRLRELKQHHVEVLHDRLQQAQLRNQFASFFVVTLIIFGTASAVQKLIHPALPPLLQMLYSWGFLLLTFAPIAWFMWHLGLSPATWGLTWRNAPRSLLESFAAAAGMALLAVGWRALSKAPDEPLLTWGSLANFSRAELFAFVLTYGPHCFVQELIGRGVIQGALTRFLPETGRRSGPVVPIALTSMLFGIFHLHVSLSFALVTLVASMLFGLLYRRHGTLAGVAVLHYLLGIVTIALGFN